MTITLTEQIRSLANDVDRAAAETSPLPTPKDRPGRRRAVAPLFATACVVLLAGVVAIAALGSRGPGGSTVATSDDQIAVSEESAQPNQGEPQEDEEAQALAEIAAIDATMGPPSVLASGVHPQYGPWQITLRVSNGSLSNGFCTEGPSGGGCGLNPDLSLFGLISSDGDPVPHIIWGAPPPITTVRVAWGDGTVEEIHVIRPPGETYGFAATIMPAAQMAFSSDALDADGTLVAEGVGRENPAIHVAD